MNKLDTFLRIVLYIHIAGGTSSLITGLGAMLSQKGGKAHRNFGKIYFWSMTLVFLGAVIISIFRPTFLLMVAFFSYYLTVRGYRMLYLKGLSSGQKPNFIDWLITSISAVFILYMIYWGIITLIGGNFMGIVGIVFGLIGSSYLYKDLKNFFGPPPEKMHWWFGHFTSMAGSYISAVTAFVVVNIHINQFGFILWILPSVIGGMMIGRTVRKYKRQFAPKPA